MLNKGLASASGNDYSAIEAKKKAMAQSDHQLENIPIRDKSPIERSVEELECAVLTARELYQNLSIRLTCVKNEQPSTAGVGASMPDQKHRQPSCNMDMILMELTSRVNQLASEIRSTLDGLCL